MNSRACSRSITSYEENISPKLKLFCALFPRHVLNLPNKPCPRAASSALGTSSRTSRGSFPPAPSASWRTPTGSPSGSTQTSACSTSLSCIYNNNHHELEQRKRRSGRYLWNLAKYSVIPK